MALAADAHPRSKRTAAVRLSFDIIPVSLGCKSVQVESLSVQEPSEPQTEPCGRSTSDESKKQIHRKGSLVLQSNPPGAELCIVALRNMRLRASRR